MKKFSYTDYLLHKDETKMVALDPTEITETHVYGTVFYYKNHEFMWDEKVEFPIYFDVEKGETYILYAGGRIYATNYYNPEVSVFISV